MRSFVASWNSIGDVGAGISPWMSASNEARYALLAEDSQKARFDALEALIYENLELTRVRMKAQSAQRADHEKLYREQALRKQIAVLQQELDELHPEEESDLRALEKKIEGCGMNELALKEARKLLSRLKSEGQSGHESGMLTDYLEFLTSLPWKKEEAKAISLDEAEFSLISTTIGTSSARPPPRCVL